MAPRDGLCFKLSLVLRRNLPLLLRLSPGILQRRSLLSRRPRPIQDLLESSGHNLVELLDDQACGAVLQEVIDELDCTLEVARLFGHKKPCSQPGWRRDARALYGREREDTNLEVLHGLDDLRDQPGARGVHRSLTRIEQ